MFLGHKHMFIGFWPRNICPFSILLHNGGINLAILDISKIRPVGLGHIPGRPMFPTCPTDQLSVRRQ
jgi:hypothetical protein